MSFSDLPALNPSDFDFTAFFDMQTKPTAQSTAQSQPLSPSHSTVTTPTLTTSKLAACLSPPSTSSVSPSILPFHMTGSFSKSTQGDIAQPFLFDALIENREFKSCSVDGSVLKPLSESVFLDSVGATYVDTFVSQNSSNDTSLEEFFNSEVFGHVSAAATSCVDGAANGDECGSTTSSDDNGLLMHSSTVPYVSDLETNNLDAYATLLMMDQIMYPDVTPISSLDFSAAFKSNHLLRDMDSPVITLEAFQSILNDPSVVTVDEVSACISPNDMGFPDCLSNNATPVMTPLAAMTPSTLSPLSHMDEEDPLAFLDNFLTVDHSIKQESKPVSTTRRPVNTRGKLLTRAAGRVSSARTGNTVVNYQDRDSESIKHELLDPNDILKMSVDQRRKEYVCPYKGCTVGCSRRYNLKIHYMTHLPIPSTSVECAGASVDTYSCFVCGKVMRRRFDMQRHRIAVHGVPQDVSDSGREWDGETSGDESTGAKRKGTGKSPNQKRARV